ncbi:MAG: hypothetical protein CME26_13960 [Gemmatimonadetes bacterium]|nr:hypothetical protein [Gemmatimonadota bacterium]
MYASHPWFSRFSYLLLILFSACGSEAPTGIRTSDMQGTWSGTFDGTNLMGRTLSGDVDWTFERDTFQLVFFNAPVDQAERIEGDWKFVDGKVVVTLKSSFPIDTDIGVTDTLFVSILQGEMSVKSNATPTAVLLQKTRLGLGPWESTPWNLARRERNDLQPDPRAVSPVLKRIQRSQRALIHHTHPPV